MENPTFENFVCYSKEDPPDQDGMIRCYSIYGVKNKNDTNSIYLWRNYNTFDQFPTVIEDGFVLEHNGYLDCDKCNELNSCCDEHIEKRKEHMENYRFGKKVFMEDYVPIKIECNGDVYYTHDNGGRPFKVYVDNDNKELSVYSLNRNLIFERKSKSRSYDHTHLVKFSENTEFQLAMNPKCDNDCENDENENESDLRNESENDAKECELESHEGEKEDDNSKYYDQFIGKYSFEKIWIPDGSYLTRDSSGKVVEDVCRDFLGNSILAHIGKENGLNKYLSIGASVNEFTIDDEITRYYSTVGNSDVPYPVAIGNKCIIFMCLNDLIAEPIEKYASLTEEQLSDAYTYFYGHLCLMCHKYDCECKIPYYEKIDISRTVICKRDF